MRKLIFLVLALSSFFAEAQFVGGGGRRVTIIMGGDSSGTSAPLTPQRITTALGYTPLNPNILQNGDAFISALSKSRVGLGNVDNTSDLNKPLSTAATNALNAKLNISALGTINGQSLSNGGNISIVTNDASGITIGTLSSARLASDVTRNAAVAVLTNKTIDYSLNTATNIPQSAMPTLAGSFAAKMNVFTPATINGTSVTSGATLNLATPDAASIVTGVFDDARFPVGLARYTGAGTFTGKTIDGDDNTVRDLGQNAVKFLSDSLARKVNVADLATSINGISLRNGGAPITISGGGGSTTDASQLITGTLSEARLPATVVKTTTVQSNPSWLSITPSYIGLGSVNNTADLDKPVSNAQATINATKAGLTAANTFSGSNTFTGTLTVGNTLSAQNITFPTGSTYNIGSSGTRGGTAYFNAFLGGSSTTNYGTGTGTAGVVIRKGASGVNSMVIDGPTSRILFQKPSSNQNFDAELFTLDGGISIKGGIATNPDSIQTFATNADAIAGGVKPNRVYKTVTSDGEWLLKIAHPTGQVAAPIVAPVYNQNIPNGTQNANTTTFVGTPSEVTWRAQTANKSWSMSRASGKGTIPIYRFEVQPGDNASVDLPSDGSTPTNANSNWQNNGVKERSELYQYYPETTPLDAPIWTAWSFLIEGNPALTGSAALNQYGAINYGEPIPNKDYLCAIGQWHGSPKNGAPHWSLDLSTVYGKDSIDLNTIGGTTSGTSGWVNEKATFPITRNVWHSIVVKAIHRNEASVPATKDGVNGGEISIWVDGRLVYNGTNIALGYTDGSDAGYMKFGVYRTRLSTANSTNTAVQYANMEVSTSDLSSRILNPLPLD